jgi:hypothetical protein
MAIIDSLFHNYYIPPVVFALSKDPVDGYETRLCVDGKQRLTSIQKFFDGQVRPRSLFSSFPHLSSPASDPNISRCPLSWFPTDSLYDSQHLCF